MKLHSLTKKYSDGNERTGYILYNQITVFQWPPSGLDTLTDVVQNGVIDSCFLLIQVDPPDKLHRDPRSVFERRAEPESCLMCMFLDCGRKPEISREENVACAHG